MNDLKEDIKDVGILMLFCAAIIIITFLCAMVGEYLVGVALRMGLASIPSLWVVHLSGLFMALGVVFSVGGRLVNGVWWWKQ